MKSFLSLCFSLVALFTATTASADSVICKSKRITYQWERAAQGMRPINNMAPPSKTTIKIDGKILSVYDEADPRNNGGLVQAKYSVTVDYANMRVIKNSMQGPIVKKEFVTKITLKQNPGTYPNRNFVPFTELAKCLEIHVLAP